MAELLLTQDEADKLLGMEKHCVDNKTYLYPGSGVSLIIPLFSADRRESFLLDVNRKYFDIKRATYQNRARQVIVLVRLDVEGPPHHNPDGTDIPAPHIHIYKEGFHDKWAYSVSKDKFTDLSDLWLTLEEFMRYCNITNPPDIQRGLFV